MRRVRRRDRDRGAVPELHATGAAEGRADRAARGDRHDAAARGLRRLEPAGGADRPARGSGERAAVVRPDGSGCQEGRPGAAEMKRRVSGIGCRVSGAAIALLGAGVAPLAGQTSLSIYRDGRVVVRQSLPQALQRGRNLVTLRLEGLDPATLFSSDTAVAVASATVRYPSSKGHALASAVGQTLSFVRAKGDTIRATVVRADPPQYRLSDGRLLLDSPGEPLFPAELVRTSPEASLALDASRARPGTELVYVGQGATWEALYQVILMG